MVSVRRDMKLLEFSLRKWTTLCFKCLSYTFMLKKMIWNNYTKFFLNESIYSQDWLSLRGCYWRVQCILDLKWQIHTSLLFKVRHCSLKLFKFSFLIISDNIQVRKRILPHQYQWHTHTSSRYTERLFVLT